MKNLTTITSTNSLPVIISKIPYLNDGFDKQLDQAIKASDRKDAIVKQATQEDISHSSDDQLGNTLNHIKGSALANTNLSAGMLNIYIVQEMKNLRSLKSRSLAATAAYSHA